MLDADWLNKWVIYSTITLLSDHIAHVRGIFPSPLRASVSFHAQIKKSFMFTEYGVVPARKGFSTYQGRWNTYSVNVTTDSMLFNTF